MKDKLTLLSVSEEKKNRLLNEIVKDFFYKPMQLALDYKPDSQEQSPKVTELYEIEGQETSVKENISTSSSCSVVLQSSPSTAVTSKLAEVHKCAQLISNPYYEYEMSATDVRRVEIAGCSSESSSGQYYSDQDSFIYLDDVQEFKSPTKQGKGMHCVDQDQRFFMFGSTSSFSSRRSVSKEKQSLDDLQPEIYYSHRPNNSRRKYQKEVVDQNGIKVASSDCSLDQPCYFYTNNSNAIMFHKGKQGVEKVSEYQVEGEEILEMGLTTTSPDVPRTSFDDYMDSFSPTNCWAVVPYVKAAVALPATQEMEIMKSRVDQTIYRSNSDLPVEEDVHSGKNSASPKHVHPKLPDYDEIAAKFMALKKVHQQKQTSLQVR
ncbi:hypothetical protein BVRB_7g176710 [Beta vulgaris subsp. vulgaris]|nr:hypothetical protein BVRB_7g176710 [Beta vulgaris subsp. vulgaris]